MHKLVTQGTQKHNNTRQRREGEPTIRCEADDLATEEGLENDLIVEDGSGDGDTGVGRSPCRVTTD
jgi:hypothetical protein